MQKQIAGKVPVLPTGDKVVAEAGSQDSEKPSSMDGEKTITIATDPSDVANLSNN